MDRDFLGWDRPPLAAATEWLQQQFGSNLEGVLVALPGARAGRILSEQLARTIGTSLRPPTIVTAGLASDQLLDLDGVPAGRLVRTLAWRKALAGLSPQALSGIVADPPAEDDLAAWMRLAEEVRTLFGEVAAEGLDFARVAESQELAEWAGEQRRWAALASAQAGMTKLVEEAGFVDPHLGRLRAIDAGRTSAANNWRAICLVGVTELNALLRRALEQASVPVTALVFAPSENAELFDEQGGLIPEAWSSWRTSLDAERQWFVVDSPADQAEQAARVIASWDGMYSAEQISLGVTDSELSPFLQGTLAEGGVRARDAAGVANGRTSPAVLLAAVARFLSTRAFEDFGTLVRHPDFESALCARAAEGELASEFEPVSWVDAYHDGHLPLLLNGEWSCDKSDKRDRVLAKNMSALWEAASGLLGEFETATSQSAASDFTAVISSARDFLERVYGTRELDHEAESDRVLIGALSALGKGLTELESLPPSLAPKAVRGSSKAGSKAVAETLELLLRVVASGQVPPAAAKLGEPTIELLGWLELALDDAPALIVTGFEQGKVPETIRGDTYLPNRLRQSLGIVDNDRRLARDLYATELLLQSREEVAFISGRRNSAGDPQVPSRIIFHCEESDVPLRTRRFLNGTSPRTSAQLSGEEKGYRPPRGEVERKLESIGVTSFARFLSAPYLFYLEKVLRLNSTDDRSREIQPMSFGNLAHDVLQAFGEKEGLRDSTEESDIAEFLSNELGRRAKANFGKSPLPAVRLQLEQLDFRLRTFAHKQAERAADGWRIRETEWEPASKSYEFIVDDEPIQIRGRIDRFDYHPGRGEWAIWDYKTGEKCDKPLTKHRKKTGEWRDLQLPLYCLLAEELLQGAEPTELGFISIAKSPSDIGFKPLKGWSVNKQESLSFADGVERAVEVARDVVRQIRAGDFFELKGIDDRVPIFAAIAGVGAISDGGAAEGDDE